MLHPVGKLPPAVYWRRRLVFVGLPLLLLVLLVVYITGGDGKPQSATAGSAPRTSSTRPTSNTSISVSPSTASSPTATSPTASTTATATATATGPVAGRICAPTDLSIQAATGKPAYVVNSRPDLYLVVTNISTAACRQDLADPQIVLIITAGGARIWGSHDCGIEPGTDLTLLAPRAPVRRSIIWSGMTSVPGCTGERLVSQAGSYNLAGTLLGKTSAPAAFTLTPSS